jgi:hypothetical protein
MRPTKYKSSISKWNFEYNYPWVRIVYDNERFISISYERLHLFIKMRDNHVLWDIDDNKKPIIDGVDEI